jgi:hypothetical protein
MKVKNEEYIKLGPKKYKKAKMEDKAWCNIVIYKESFIDKLLRVFKLWDTVVK